MYFVTRKVLVRLQLRNLLQAETCSIYARNFNFEELNFGPHKNDYRADSLSRQCGSLDISQPSGSLRSLTGTAFNNEKSDCLLMFGVKLIAISDPMFSAPRYYLCDCTGLNASFLLPRSFQEFLP
jgi:hypothetical protein